MEIYLFKSYINTNRSVRDRRVGIRLKRTKKILFPQTDSQFTDYSSIKIEKTKEVVAMGSMRSIESLPFVTMMLELVHIGEKEVGSKYNFKLFSYGELVFSQEGITIDRLMFSYSFNNLTQFIYRRTNIDLMDIITPPVKLLFFGDTLVKYFDQFSSKSDDFNGQLLSQAEERAALLEFYCMCFIQNHSLRSDSFEDTYNDFKSNTYLIKFMFDKLNSKHVFLLRFYFKVIFESPTSIDKDYKRMMKISMIVNRVLAPYIWLSIYIFDPLLNKNKDLVLFQSEKIKTLAHLLSIVTKFMEEPSKCASDYFKFLFTDTTLLDIYDLQKDIESHIIPYISVFESSNIEWVEQRKSSAQRSMNVYKSYPDIYWRDLKLSPFRFTYMANHLIQNSKISESLHSRITTKRILLSNYSIVEQPMVQKTRANNHTGVFYSYKGQQFMIVRQANKNNEELMSVHSKNKQKNEEAIGSNEQLTGDKKEVDCDRKVLLPVDFDKESIIWSREGSMYFNTHVTMECINKNNTKIKNSVEVYRLDLEDFLTGQPCIIKLMDIKFVSPLASRKFSTVIHVTNPQISLFVYSISIGKPVRTSEVSTCKAFFHVPSSNSILGPGSFIEYDFLPHITDVNCTIENYFTLGNMVFLETKNRKATTDPSRSIEYIHRLYRIKRTGVIGDPLNCSLVDLSLESRENSYQTYKTLYFIQSRIRLKRFAIFLGSATKSYYMILLDSPKFDQSSIHKKTIPSRCIKGFTDSFTISSDRFLYDPDLQKMYSLSVDESKHTITEEIYIYEYKLSY